jgi:hypothetical protein
MMASSVTPQAAVCPAPPRMPNITFVTGTSIAQVLAQTCQSTNIIEMIVIKRESKALLQNDSK